VTPLSPAPVAVHNDGNVLRQPICVKLSKQSLFLAA
jgi:hypothetical protein